MCKKLKILVVLAILLLVGTVVNAGQIHLKDGRIIEVERCWEKNDEVIFKLEPNGRLFSVSKELVTRIIGKKDDGQEKGPPR